MKKVIKKSAKRVLGLDTRDYVNDLKAEIFAKLDETIKVETAITDKLIEKLDQHDFRIDEIKEKLKSVENYQPIYGVAGLVDTPARESRDRCDVMYESLGDVAGMRVLDIGSSLGYVSFYFADRGAYVEGWESNLQNAEVARLASNINGVRANFVSKELNLDTVSTVQDNFFDVVIVLSVFHHIIRFQGLEATQKLVKTLLEKAPVMIVELAKKGEDKNLPWDKSQPKDELEIFAGLDVKITKIGSFGNHLSSNKRPLYKVEANNAVEVNGRKYTYESTSLAAYTKSPLRKIESFRRKYYFAKDYIIKEYGLRSGVEKQFNIPEAYSEISALAALSKLQKKKALKFDVPELIDAEVNKEYSRLVISRASGELLSDLALSLAEATEKEKNAVAEVVINDVLGQLAGLRELGLYHNDVRSWNIIVGKNQALLIDYGNTSQVASDNDITGLLWALAELLSGGVEKIESSKDLPAKSLLSKSSAATRLYSLVKAGEADPVVLMDKLKNPSKPKTSKS